MKKSFFSILIIAVALLFCGCGTTALSVEDPHWQYRNYYLRDETMGFEDISYTKNIKYPAVYATASRLPSVADPLTDNADKKILDGELDEMYAALDSGIASGKGLRHELAYAAFGIDENTFLSTARIVRNVYPAACGLQSAGLFLPAGEIVKITVPQEWADKGIKIVINANRNDIASYRDYTRIPRLYYEFDVSSDTTYISHPFGGTVDVYLPQGLSKGKITFDGCVGLGYYRLGIDNAATLSELKNSVIGVAALDFGAGFAYLDRDILQKTSDGEEALYWWNSVLKRVGELCGNNRVFRFYSDPSETLSDPLNNSLTFTTAVGGDFLNATALKNGKCLNIITSLTDLLSDIGGADKTARSASLFINGTVEKEYTSSRIIDSYAEAAVALNSIAAVNDKSDYLYLTAADKAGLYINLWHSFGTQKLAQLLAQMRSNEPYTDIRQQREEFALAACRLYGYSFVEYFRLYKLNLDPETEKIMQQSGYSEYYPIANRFAGGVKDGETRNHYFSGTAAVTVDFAAATADPFNVYELSDVKCSDGFSLNDDGKYDVVLTAGEHESFELTYTNKQSGKQTVLSGALTRDSYCAPSYLPLDSGASDGSGLYYVNPRSESITHKGGWVTVCDGAYANGASLAGKKGAYMSMDFFADSVTLLAQTDSPRCEIKVRVDGGKYRTYELGGVSDSGVTLDGLTNSQHKIELKVSDGILYLKAIGLNSKLYSTDFTDAAKLFDFSEKTYKNPYDTLYTALYVAVPLLAAAMIVLVLLAVIFPFINRKTGSDLPCITLRLRRPATRGGAASLGTEDLAEEDLNGDKGRSKAAKGHKFALDWDDNWVKEVALPPITHAEKAAEKVVSPVLVANAPFITEVEKAADFVRAEVSKKSDVPPEEKSAPETERAEKSESAAPQPRPARPIVRAQMKPLPSKQSMPQVKSQAEQESAKGLGTAAPQVKGQAEQESAKGLGTAAPQVKSQAEQESAKGRGTAAPQAKSRAEQESAKGLGTTAPQVKSQTIREDAAVRKTMIKTTALKPIVAGKKESERTENEK